MIILSNSTDQTIGPGESATFDTIILKTGNAECFRINTGAVRLRFSGAMYDVDFGGNIASSTADTEAQLAIAYDGSPMVETTMISQTNTAGNLQNVSNGTSIETCCCRGGAVTIVNTGTQSVTIGKNPKFRIRRVAYRE